ncbi:hypothetical protein KIN20_027295 [Parelaphostrongylus tenuis]|uniref:Uncharacterized protein n=1 Tax=Parelaphostrongylus tenuis TaxID=148309 RepID=A0AAD5QZF0_PARTN|nr:hypothetical protein KIN20_027295 [Parelaphostrongylus tenuis]
MKIWSPSVRLRENSRENQLNQLDNFHAENRKPSESKLGREWRRCAMGGLVRSMDWSFAIHGPTTTRVERLQLVRAAAGQAVLTRASNQLAKELDNNEAIIKDILGLPQERRESKEDINTLRVQLRRAINELDFRMNNVQAALDKYNAAVDQLGASAASDRTEMDKVEEL